LEVVEKMLKCSILFAAVLAVVVGNHETLVELRAITRLDGEGISGNITFTQLTDGNVHVAGSIFGLPPGQYGFHVHEKGDITGGCASTGAHFNPEHKDHGHPTDENRHVGDLGNVIFNPQRYATIDFLDGKIALFGPHCILGRAVVLHEKEDDFGRSSHPDSRKTGNAGGRVACGVIGLL